MGKRIEIDPNQDSTAKIFWDRHKARVFKEPDGTITIEYPDGLIQRPGGKRK